MFPSWRFALSASNPSAATYFFRSAQSFLSFDQVALVLHSRGPPMPTRTRPKPQRATAEDPHWEWLPNLGLGNRLATSAWHDLNTIHISTNKLNTHERPHTDKPRPYPTGPTHLPQAWRRGEKQKKTITPHKSQTTSAAEFSGARDPPPRAAEGGGQATPNEDQGASWPIPGARKVLQTQLRRTPNGKVRTRGSCGAAPGPPWGAPCHHQSGPRHNEHNQGRVES